MTSRWALAEMIECCTPVSHDCWEVQGESRSKVNTVFILNLLQIDHSSINLYFFCCADKPFELYRVCLLPVNIEAHRPVQKL
ncbi:hypothetical protein GDO78_010472 [Eleutherodactylus coqui]|uniref:Uncharacterized protein n=1 Tax=Eleutherodactylus coqui TaxID=57060 RepID=A0A8J6F5S2_ELECQ|nr:hypothetical protein GDO78_010472 [Eleutherodactylus coqui]